MRALGTKVVVAKHEDKTEELTSGGIILQKVGEDKSPREGTVLSVGNDVKNLSFKDVVMFPRFAGVPFKSEGQDCVVLEFSEILVVV